MEAVILAAGKGVRLHPHTLTTPKPLLPVQGRPILDWLLAALPLQVERVIVVVNYLAEKIEAHLASRDGGRAWVTVKQTEPRGTGDALRCCREHLRGDRFLVLNGDDLYAPDDLAKLARYPAGVLAHPVDQPHLFGIVFSKADGSLERLEEKPSLTGTHLANIGAYLFPRSVFELPLQLSSRGEYEITDWLSQLAANQPVQVVRATFWHPIGNIEAWHAAEQITIPVVRPTS
ncbi:MAG TPA: nucleotidyltransferase family protein [Gemmatales bacterium]|nr:nucleotidyltransferase family protein [Gemmatales bacterium]HMP58825.1 nucleotidyltransferase family protein [Gemmatales bacterium]